MFEIGDIVKVVANINGHQFKIGDIIKVGEVQNSSAEPSIDTKDGNVYICEYLDGSDFYYLGSNEIEKVEK